MKCEHDCMKVRGVEEPCCDTATSSMNGLFMHNSSAKKEMFELINLKII